MHGIARLRWLACLLPAVLLACGGGDPVDVGDQNAPTARVAGTAARNVGAGDYGALPVSGSAALIWVAPSLGRRAGTKSIAAATDQPGTPIDVEVGKAARLIGYVFINPSTCEYLEGGSFQPLIAPKHGVIVFRTEVNTYDANIAGPCAGKSLPFETAYYTWTDRASTETSDSFSLRFTTTSGSASADNSWTANLSQRPPTAKIKFDGKDITNNASDPAGAVVGMKIKLEGEIEDLPNGSTISVNKWSITSEAVGGYATSDSKGRPLQVGGPLPVVTSQQEVVFHWVAPRSKTGAPQTVTWTATLSTGQVVSATASFILIGPSYSIDLLRMGKANIELIPSLGQFLNFGSLDEKYGIHLKASSDDPSFEPGFLTWVQLLTEEELSGETGQFTKECRMKVPALDTQYPYQGGGEMHDSPYAAIFPRSITTTHSFSARTFLMWDPMLPRGCTPQVDNKSQGNCESIPVPLGYVDWGFQSKAVRNRRIPSPRLPGAFTVAESVRIPNVPTFTESTTFPAWAYLSSVEIAALNCTTRRTK